MHNFRSKNLTTSWSSPYQSWIVYDISRISVNSLLRCMTTTQTDYGSVPLVAIYPQVNAQNVRSECVSLLMAIQWYIFVLWNLCSGRRYCTTTRVEVDCGGRWKCPRTCSSKSSSSTRWTSRSSASSSRRKASSSSGGRCRPVTGSVSSGCCVRNPTARDARVHSLLCPSPRSSFRLSTSAPRRSQCSLTAQSVSTSLILTVSLARCRSVLFPFCLAQHSSRYPCPAC